MNEQEALTKMTSPNMRRRCWGEGILQIHITRVCDKSCFGCTQGSNLGGKPVVMSVDEFEQAVISLKDYFGIVGVFGGNPCMHPNFVDICAVYRRHIPFERRGIWVNKLFGHGKTVRETFNPNVSNVNVHGNQEDYDEFSRDWPEIIPTLKGLKDDSRHVPPYVAIQDVISDKAKRWELIANCDINKHWSAMVCTVPTKGLRGFFCEVAAAQAMLHAHDPSWPDIGLEVKPGWWNQDIKNFAEQVNFYCHRCGIPLRRFGQLAVGGDFEEVSQTHLDIYKPKDKSRRVQLITMQSESSRKVDLMIRYIENSTLK